MSNGNSYSSDNVLEVAIDRCANVCCLWFAGELREYVQAELNVYSLETCSDPLHYAALRGEPEWQVLGKRLGKDMGKVAGAIKGLTAQQLMDYEKHGSIVVAGHELAAGDIKVGSKGF